MVKEIDTVLRKQIEQGDAKVRELIQIIQTDLSTRLKGAIVKISV